MDFEETADAAINKGKYLLNQMFKQKKVPEEHQPSMCTIITQENGSSE